VQIERNIMNIFQDAYQQKMMTQEIRFFNRMVFSCFQQCSGEVTAETLSPEEQRCGEMCMKKTLASLDKVKLSVGQLANK
jgi:hypothetical protein